MALKTHVIATADESLPENERKILLAGESVFVSLQSGVPDGFIAQAPCDASASLVSQFAKHVPKVYVSVDERLFEASKVRFGLAVEGYVKWGLRDRRKGTTVLLGGAQTPQSTIVSIFVFTDGQVAEVDEKVLPESTATYFRDALLAMVAELRIKYPTARMVQAAPLDNWDIQDIEYLGEKPLRSITYRPLTRGYSPRQALVLPAAVSALGFAAYIGALAAGWSMYSSSIESYDMAIADPSIQTRGGIDTNFLDTMNARRQFMEQPRRQTVLAEKAASIVRGIGSVAEVRILELRLPAPSVNPQQQVGVTINRDHEKKLIAADRAPDVWISISVPKSPDAALNQAQSVMTTIANHTGMSLRLAHQGWRDDQSRRVFNIEGFIHD